MRGVSTLLGVLVLGISCQFYDATLTESPASTAAIAGTAFQLNCAFDNTSIGDTNWQFTGLSANPVRIVYRCEVVPDFADVYSVSQTDEGSCHLTVLNPARASAGTYTCMNAFEQASAIVVVLDSVPNCMADPTDDLLTGDFIQISCVINYAGSLSPRMHWSVSDTAEPINNDTTNTFPNQVNSHISVPVYPPTSRPFVCQTYFDKPIEYSYTWTLPPINVQYFVQRIVAVTRVHYFEQSTLVCSANGFPAPSYLWINLNTGVTFPGNTVNVNPNGVSLFACNASNTIRGETVTLQVLVGTEITQDAPENCGTIEPPTEEIEPTTPTTPEPTTTPIPTTTPPTTPEPIGACGRIFNVVPPPPDAPAVPDGWDGMCYISQNDTSLLTTQCRNLIVDLPPHYADYTALLAAGGNFGCALTTRGDFLQGTNACSDNLGQTTILASCESCPRLLMCYRLPPALRNIL